MNDIKTILDALVCAPGVSGAEGEAIGAAAGMLGKTAEIRVSPSGSLITCLVPPGAHEPHLLLTAHIDQIGLVVTHEPEGEFVRASCVGGVDRRMVSGARVEILTPGGRLPGVITSTPPHLQSGEKKLPKPQVIIDIGSAPTQTIAALAPGCPVRFVSQPGVLLNGRYTAPALDNRAGCAAVIAAGLELAGSCSGFGLSLALTSTEETGGVGGATAAFGMGITHAVVVDVTMAATGFEPAHEAGKMGGGPMVGFSPALNYNFALQLESLAAAHAVPTQREVMPGSTGTDSESIAKSAGGIKAALLSIPIRFMHTTAEVVQISDIAYTARLMAAIRKETLC